MDSAGAMLGPLVAFGILLVAPARFDAVFVVSTLFALLGLAVLVLAVQGRPQRAPREEADAALAAGGGRPAPRPPLRALLLAAAGLSLASVSDALIYVGLQRKIDFEPAVFPLLYVITAVVFMGLAIPVGQLADRVGRVPVLLGGHALLFVVYGALLMSSLGYGVLVLCLVAPRRLLRRHRRGDDGARRGDPAGGAAGEWDRDADHRGQPRRLLSSVAFGALWFALGLQSAVLVFAVALVLAIAVAAPLLLRAQRAPAAWIAAASRILAALVVALRRARWRLRRARRARARARRPPMPGPRPATVLGPRPS